MIPPVIHIVRRYGPVGGMESYVWLLTHGLADSGVKVIIMCEELFEQPTRDIEVITVSKSKERPRWRSMISFRELIDIELDKHFNLNEVIVHSHERSIRHHVTTVHGPLINAKKNSGILNTLIPRVRSWTAMEKDEFLGPTVKVIAPVSKLIGEAVFAEYPTAKEKRVEIAWPGVKRPKSSDTSENRSLDQVTFLFIGKEWKRKGLKTALKIFKNYTEKKEGNAELHIYGVEPHELPPEALRLKGVSVHGWKPDIPWHKYSILLHLATSEPFGMVVAEARAHGVPVLASTEVGATDLKFTGVKVITKEQRMDEINAIIDSILLDDSMRLPEIRWTWADLVKLHLQTIYPSCLKTE